MAVKEAVRLDVGHGRQTAVIDIIEEVGEILDVSLTLGWIAHDRLAVLEAVADITVPVATGADHHVERVFRSVVETSRRIEATTVICPADLLLVERITDMAQRRGRRRGAAIDLGGVENAIREIRR